MKTLHFAIISFLLCVIMSYAGIVSAQSPSNDLGNGSLLSITTTKNAFSAGDIIDIHGNSLPNYHVELTLVGPNGTIKDSRSTFSDRDGQFSSYLQIPKYAEGGAWKILGKSGTYNAELDFNIFEQQIEICQGCTPNIPQSQNSNATVLSPLKQFKSGIAANSVKCQQDLQLVIKAEDGSPTCVGPQTAQKLVERGWGWAMHQTDSIKPLMSNRIPGLENDTGIVTLGNQTYYFETSNYMINSADYNPVQPSFHDVVFTLFPAGFRGGLPTGVGCGNVTAGEIVIGGGSYFWTDAKFSDGTHELLHIYADSKPCPVNPIPTDFSNHANPQAGLTSYDGKMKLLVSTNNPKLSFMNIKVFSSYTPSSLVDHFLTGNLHSTAGPIQNGNITITVNGVTMGTAETYPNGCFQFNNWNDSKLADQINKSRSLGNDSTELNFQTQYFGDSNHNPVNASAGSYLQFYAVPLAPAQYDTNLSPSSEINVTQGNFTQFHVTVKPFSKYWEVQHMKLNLQRTPCGLSYHISPVDNNDSVLINNTASFGVILNTTSYTPSGKYWISIDQDMSGINEPNIGAEVGAFDLNVLKK